MNRLVVISVMALAVALAACGSAQPTLVPTVELSLIATDIAYDVNRLEVVAGQPVRLTLHNEGVLEHDFSIMEMPHTGEVMVEEMEEGMASHDMSEMTMDPEIHIAAPVDDNSTIEFTPSMPGEYEFFCTTAGHKEAGMVGTLVVKAP